MTTGKKEISKSKTIIAFFVSVIVIVVFAGVGCESLTGSTTYSMEYEITGTAHTTSVTYENENGGISQIDSVYLPWTYYFTAESGDFAYISAQNNGESGTVTVNIYKDGNLWKTSTSSGAYVIATANDMLP